MTRWGWWRGPGQDTANAVLTFQFLTVNGIGLVMENSSWLDSNHVNCPRVSLMEKVAREQANY